MKEDISDFYRHNQPLMGLTDKLLHSALINCLQGGGRDCLRLGPRILSDAPDNLTERSY